MHMNKGGLYAICTDMCSFIMREIIPCSRRYHDATSELAKPEKRWLTEIEKLNLKREDY